jgi:hypothetical protein
VPGREFIALCGGGLCRSSRDPAAAVKSQINGCSGARLSPGDNVIMRLLVLGGTRFVGRAIVSTALNAEWEVTTFNRGKSGPSIDGARTIHGDRTNPERLARLADAGPWDAVVDRLNPHQVPEVLAEQLTQDRRNRRLRLLTGKPGSNAAGVGIEVQAP